MAKFNVSEIKGIRSLRAFNVYNSLLLGIKMLPQYLKESYEEFYSRLKDMEPDDQAKIIREAAFFIEIQPEELEAMAIFCKDSNGVPISRENLKNFSPGDLIDMIEAVCTEISKFKIDLVSEAEKKNSVTSQ